MTLIGSEIEKLDTPALWVDLAQMEANIANVAGYLKEAGVAWRPHTKGIKIPAIAHKLRAAGAVGVTCAKLGEAEVMADAGITDILVGNQIVGEPKITRLGYLQKQAEVMVSVTELENAQQIARRALELGVQVPVLVELNVGMNRAGVEPGPRAVELACRLAEMPGIKFAGLMGWEGHVVSIPDPQVKQAEGERAIRSLVETAEACRQVGLRVPIVSCGGSGSFRISANIPGVTEIQTGGAIFGDVTYRRWGAGTEPALFVLSTVTSRPTPTRLITDAGCKTMNHTMSLPEVRGYPGVRLTHLSAEHGILELDDPDLPIRTGDKLNFTAGYGDWTVFLHDELYGVRDGKVEVVWKVLGRGKLN